MPLVVYYSSESHQLCSFQPDREDYIRCRLDYLNEGGANFIFRILPFNTSEEQLPETLQHKLLRLRKNHSHVPSIANQLESFDKHFRPLFSPNNLVQLDLIKLSTALLNDLNAFLRNLPRPSKRVADIIAESETHGLLVTDMSSWQISNNDDGHDADGSSCSRSQLSLEFKPKWLSQSSSAPVDAKRCRTCALRALRAAESTCTATDEQDVCPLALVSEEAEVRMGAVRRLTCNGGIQNLLTQGEGQNLLLQLRKWQVEFDKRGVLAVGTAADADAAPGVGKEEVAAEQEVSDLCKAMTLRDCSLFVVERSAGRFEVRLADLDLKMSERLPKWRETEQGLLCRGWYTNEEDPGVWREEQICLLSESACQSGF